MVANLKPAIIFLQETMIEGKKAKEFLESWLKGWSFGHISSEGHSRGLITAWNQEFEEVAVAKHNTVLKTVLMEKAIGESYALYNVYGPYQENKGFWETFFFSRMLDPKNMILRGDLNLTFYEKENWGPLARNDGMGTFFATFFQSKDLVDFQPLKLTAT